MKTKLADVKTSELKSKPVSSDLEILTSAKNGTDFLNRLVCEELDEELDDKQGAEYCQVCGELYPCAAARETNETYPTYWSDR